MWNSSIRFFLYNPSVVLALLLLSLAGLAISPLRIGGLAWRHSMPVDALPDLGENQQIIRTEWPGQAATRIEEQLNYPLSAELMGVAGVRSVRGQAMFGVSFLYVIFEESVDFYDSRARLLERLSSLPDGLLPKGVRPQLGPSATALGQVYMYVLVGRDSLGRPAGGWGLEELRRFQDFELKQQLLSVAGVVEVATIGGHERAFEVVLDPLRLKAQQISVAEIAEVLRNSDIEVGAQTIDINEVEYTLQGLAKVQQLSELEEIPIASQDGSLLRIGDIAKVQASSLPRRALLDYEGAEAVGGIVTMQYGADAASVIAAIERKVKEINPKLPKKRNRNGILSQLHILPYYNRGELIAETMGTLRSALVLEVLIVLLVMLWMMRSLQGALVIAGLLPLSILLTFLCMYVAGVEAHIVSLAGIAIAIGTVVDMGILLWDNVKQHAAAATTSTSKRDIVLSASLELAPSLRTAMGSTLLSFLPVFALEASEGRLFHPLAWTKTFTMVSAFVLSLYVMPAVFVFFLRKQRQTPFSSGSWIDYIALAALLLGGSVWVWSSFWGSLCVLLGVAEWLRLRGHLLARWAKKGHIPLYTGWVLWVLSQKWLPLGTAAGSWGNLLLVGGACVALLSLFWLLLRGYGWIFGYCWRYRVCLMVGCLVFVLMGLLAWQGGEKIAGTSRLGRRLSQYFPGLSRSFMPPLEEGSFLLMPIGAPHAGLEVHKKNIQQLDKAIAAIPEVSEVVGKLGRAETALDPAPMHMYEIIVNYKPEYIEDKDGQPIRFAVDERGNFLKDSSGELVPDATGQFYRNWRSQFRSPDDIWAEIEQLQPSTVSRAPKLQPIETRRLMLQTGIRSRLVLKVRGQSLEAISSYAKKAATALEHVKGIASHSIYTEPLIGKPYLQLEIRRSAAQRHGLQATELGNYIKTAIGGAPLLMLQEGRSRWPLLMRYGSEAKESPESLAQLPIRTPSGAYVALDEVVEITYKAGPQMVRSEDSWPVTYVLFEAEKGFSAPEVVASAEQLLQTWASEGKLPLPTGINYSFDGTYKDTLRAEQRFLWIIPLAFLLICVLLYVQFRKLWLVALVFGGLLLSFAGSFLCLWMYQLLAGDALSVLGEVFGIGREVSLNTAVWVGFVALFGIATDNGVVMVARLKQAFLEQQPKSSSERLQTAIQAGKTRLRSCLMTTATTLLALLPLLSATGKGGELMRALALPLFGGTLLSPVLLFLIPIMYGLVVRTKAGKK